MKDEIQLAASKEVRNFQSRRVDSKEKHRPPFFFRALRKKQVLPNAIDSAAFACMVILVSLF
jgi:hypothetical protein